MVSLFNLVRELVRSGFIRKPEPIARTVIAYAKIYPILTTMLHETGADRVALLKTTNGGGIPRPGSTLRSSVLAEVLGDKIDAIAHTWQEQLLDRDYVHMLSKLIGRGCTYTITEDLDDDSMLRILYEGNGIAFSKVVLIDTLPEMLIYVSVNFAEGTPETLTAEQREGARAGANQLKQVLNPKGNA